MPDGDLKLTKGPRDRRKSDRRSASQSEEPRQSLSELSASQGDRAGTLADQVASDRDQAAVDREVVSVARDRAATERDRAAEELEHGQGLGGPEYEAAIKEAAEVRAQAAADRELAAADRSQAGIDRKQAGVDRERAAVDREHAALDREQAAADRRMALAELHRAHVDDLTGAYRRGAGEAALQQEIDRARRVGDDLVVAFVDVDGLKATNDLLGHAAGDARLRNVVRAMRSKIRSYEPIVRFGGDEFVCSVAGVGIEGVEARFAEIAKVLGDDDSPGAVSVGLAGMRPDDTLKDLIDRADEALIAVRGA